MTSLCIDFGNTRCKWRLRASRQWQGEGVLQAPAAQPNAMLAELSQTLELTPERIIYSNVLGLDLAAKFAEHWPQAALYEQHATATFHGLQSAYPSPGNLGIDRLLAMLGARQRADGNLLVVDVGTALTIDLLAADNRHRGGLILTSPTLAAQTLRARGARLKVASSDAELVFATDTPAAIDNGALLSACASVERALAMAEDQLRAAVALWLTGGGASALRAGLSSPHGFAENLVLDGMGAIADEME